jgi:hypothetical protein
MAKILMAIGFLLAFHAAYAVSNSNLINIIK